MSDNRYYYLKDEIARAAEALNTHDIDEAVKITRGWDKPFHDDWRLLQKIISDRMFDIASLGTASWILPMLALDWGQWPLLVLGMVCWPLLWFSCEPYRVRQRRATLIENVKRAQSRRSQRSPP